MRAASAHKPGTYSDLADVPDHFVAEQVDGEVYASPRPASRHARSSSRLSSQLGGPFDEGRGGPGGWILLDEPEMHLGPHVVVPDLAGWRRERMPELPDVAYFTLAPDWVCEVLSPSTESLDRVQKMRIYAEAGVQHAWLVDPLTEWLEVYGLRGGQWVLLSRNVGDETVRAEPFATFALPLASLWAR